MPSKNYFRYREKFEVVYPSFYPTYWWGGTGYEAFLFRDLSNLPYYFEWNGNESINIPDGGDITITKKAILPFILADEYYLEGVAYVAFNVKLVVNSGTEAGVNYTEARIKKVKNDGTTTLIASHQNNRGFAIVGSGSRTTGRIHFPSIDSFATIKSNERIVVEFIVKAYSVAGTDADLIFYWGNNDDENPVVELPLIF